MAAKLGTIAAIGFDDFKSPQWLQTLRAMGCSTVQAYRNTEADVSLEEMLDYIAAGTMPCDSLHGVYGEQYDPSCPDERARLFAVDAFKSEGELALKLGGPLVVVHCSTIRPDGVDPDERRVRVAQLRKSIEELGRYGSEVGVTYAFENLPAYHPVGSDVAELAHILEQVGAPNTGMCFDTGHANMVTDAADAARRAGRHMVYCHFCDNSGQADEHLMPTYGSLDTDAVARALHEIGYAGTMMLETFYQLDELKRFIDDGCPDRLRHIIATVNGDN